MKGRKATLQQKSFAHHIRSQCEEGIHQLRKIKHPQVKEKNNNREQRIRTNITRYRYDDRQ